MKNTLAITIERFEKGYSIMTLRISEDVAPLNRSSRRPVLNLRRTKAEDDDDGCRHSSK